MLLLIIVFLFGAVLAFFATQNTAGVAINYLGYIWSDIPLYMVVIGSILVGLLLAGVITLINSFTNTFTLMGKDQKIKETSKVASDLKKRIDELEIENTRLKAEKSSTPVV